MIVSRIRASIVVSIPACHAGDRSSILRLGVFLIFAFGFKLNEKTWKISKYFLKLYILNKKANNKKKWTKNEGNNIDSINKLKRQIILNDSLLL